MRLGDIREAAKGEDETQFSMMKAPPARLVLEDGTQIVTENGTPLVE